MSKNKNCNHANVGIRPTISVLSNDFSLLANPPQINGITLLGGNQKASALNLLSNKADDYQEVGLSEVNETGFVLVLTPGQDEPVKVPLSDIKGHEEEKGFVTLGSEENIQDSPIGTYHFVLKNSEE